MENASSVITTVGYFDFLIASAVLGCIVEATSICAVQLCTALAAALITALATRIPDPVQRQPLSLPSRHPATPSF